MPDFSISHFTCRPAHFFRIYIPYFTRWQLSTFRILPPALIRLAYTKSNKGIL